MGKPDCKSKTMRLIAAAALAVILAGLNIAGLPAYAHAQEPLTGFESAYVPVIQAYADFEKSGFTAFDETLIGDSLLAKAKDAGPDMAGLGLEMGGNPTVFRFV